MTLKSEDECSPSLQSEHLRGFPSFRRISAKTQTIDWFKRTRGGGWTNLQNSPIKKKIVGERTWSACSVFIDADLGWGVALYSSSSPRGGDDCLLGFFGAGVEAAAADMAEGVGWSAAWWGTCLFLAAED